MNLKNISRLIPELLEGIIKEHSVELIILIFSILVIIIHSLIKKKKTGVFQNQKSGNNCTNFQAGRDLSIEIYDTENFKHAFTEKWFLKHNSSQIKNLGDRYLPELNVEVKASLAFNALSRNADFFEYFSNETNKILDIVKNLQIKEVNEHVKLILNIIKLFKFNSLEKLPDLELISLYNEISEILKTKISENLTERDSIQNELEKIRSKDNSNQEKTIIDKIDKNQEKYYILQTAYDTIINHIDYLMSNQIKLINTPYLLLYGVGGIGKSHLLADTINQRNSAKQKSLFFLGQHFPKNTDPFITMLNILELNCSTDVFLKKINDIAEEEKSRILLFIDALNEGNGKNIWKNYLAGMMEKLKEYPNIGLVLSIRSEYVEHLFQTNEELENKFIKIQHHGFTTVEHKAIKIFFNYYKIGYIEIPFINQEFRNPLFLGLFCKTFKNTQIDLTGINVIDIYENYLKTINYQLSDYCGFSSKINIVEKVIQSMVLIKYSLNGNNLISLDSMIKITSDIEKDNNISCQILDELFSTGLLTQNILHDGKEYVYVTYEKLEDYLYSVLLTEELNKIGVDNFRDKYKTITSYSDLLETFSIVLSEKSNFEIFEVFENVKIHYKIIYPFCNALKWRKSNTISEKTLNYIADDILKANNGVEDLFNSLVSLSTKPKHQLNAKKTVDLILSLPMAERDSFFIPLFDDLLSEKTSPLNRLIDWALNHDKNLLTPDEIVKLASLMLSVLLISCNRFIRDTATKALINLLYGKTDLVIDLLHCHENTDDPYILERLYAVAFGCVLNENNDSTIEQLALYVHNTIFNKETVYPHMLLRDYAKSIIEYAKYKVANERVLKLSINPPFGAPMPKTPSDKEIAKYRLDYAAQTYKKHHWSQNSILDSMHVEYDRNGHPQTYGNFGRYTFQYYFSHWKGLNYNDLENIAVKKIFDMGYDVDKHGIYDAKITSGQSRKLETERIGKKYQWIALHELATQVADNYKIELRTNEDGTQKKEYCINSAEPHLRDIDPTLLSFINESNLKKDIHNKLYNFPDKLNDEWTSTFNDLPFASDMIKTKYSKQDFILLNGWYSWNTEEKHENLKKNMWVLINSYIVKEADYKKILNFLSSQNFHGRWLTEPSENYHIFNKEYYWSSTCDFFDHSYYSKLGFTDLIRHSLRNAPDVNVLVPTSKYLSERVADAMYTGNYTSWYKPCKELFDALNMQYGKENSVLYNSDNKIVCFDSSELLNEDIGFFIDEELFANFLRDNNYRVIWTILSEKSIYSLNFDSTKSNMQDISQVYTYHKGKIKKSKSTTGIHYQQFFRYIAKKFKDLNNRFFSTSR